ncbi:MAG: PorP/SprF family type IX secretion system membrane protein [Bacteroidota bacterium]
MKVIFLFMVIALPWSIQAQDPVFTQFYTSRFNLNPALVGGDAAFSARVHYRRQWHQVPGGFETYAASLEFFIPSIGVGIAPFVLKDEEGTGNFRTVNYGSAFSVEVPLSSGITAHGGIRASVVEKSANLDGVIFSDQLDPVYGSIYPTNAPLTGEMIRFPELGWGTAIRGKFDYFHETAFFNAGVAGSRIFPSDDALSGLGETTKTRFSIHLGGTLPIWITHKGSKKTYFYYAPQFRYEQQQSINIFSAGSYFVYRTFFLGAFIHRTNFNVFDNKKHTNAYVLHLGVEPINKKNSVRVEYSFDINSSGINARLGGGVHELSLVYKSARFLNADLGKIKNPYNGECPFK